jgi:hypothetical protein
MEIPLSRMKGNHSRVITTLAAVVLLAFATMATPAPAVAQQKMATPAPAATQQKKPNILFIMGDDIGWMQHPLRTGMIPPQLRPRRTRIATTRVR